MTQTGHRSNVAWEYKRSGADHNMLLSCILQPPCKTTKREPSQSVGHHLSRMHVRVTGSILLSIGSRLRKRHPRVGGSLLLSESLPLSASSSLSRMHVRVTGSILLSTGSRLRKGHLRVRRLLSLVGLCSTLTVGLPSA